MKWSKFVLTVAAAGVLAAPGSLEAQRRTACCKANPWSFSPYAGFIKDAYDISPDGDDTGWQLGFRIGYALSERARLIGNIGYAESDDVSSGPMTVDRVVYDNQYIITMGGAEYDIIPGNTSVSLGGEVGGLWREVAQDEQIGQPLPGQSLESGYSFYFALAPTLTVRHGFSARTALEIGVRDYIVPDGVDHMPALTIGFRFR